MRSIKLCSWNCRGLGGPSTISQLKEELRIHQPDIVFLYETKKKKGFVQSVCKKLKYQSRSLVVDPSGLSGGLLLCWSNKIVVKQILANNFVLNWNLKIQTHAGLVGEFLFILIKIKLSANYSGTTCGSNM